MTRIGIGYDVHRLVDGRKLIIGGVDIPYEKGLLGYSDADVLLHAICDALLGAAALGDIGRHFPDTDARWRDADSMDLLRTVLANGRLAALPEIAAQYASLVNAQGGVSDAVIESAFPIEGAQLADVTATLEKRFKRKLNAKVELKPELIGGIRVIVGDEVLDTSVRARLEQMQLALTA